jgi:hypothetical protein
LQIRENAVELIMAKEELLIEIFLYSIIMITNKKLFVDPIPNPNPHEYYFLKN